MAQHTLKLTNGTSVLAHSVLNIPDTFKTPSEVMRVAELVAQIDVPAKIEDTPDWAAGNEREITIHEKARDLLKRAMETHASKLPPNKFTLDILGQLGFE